MARRNPADLWSRLVDEAGDDEIERAANVSVAQAERELAAAGFDVAGERARAAATLEALGGPKPGPAPPEARERETAEPAAWVTKAEPPAPRSRPTRWAVLLAAALAAAATGGVLYALGHRSKPIEGPREAPTVPAPAPSAAPSPAPPPPTPPSPTRESKPPP